MRELQTNSHCRNLILHINFSHSSTQTVQGVINWHISRPIDIGAQGVALRLKTIDGSVLGQIIIDDKEPAWLYYFAIHPNCRSQGLGSLLLERAEQYCKDHKHTTCYLHVQKEHEKELIPFYKHRGYEIQFKDDLVGEWVMCKHLKPIDREPML